MFLKCLICHNMEMKCIYHHRLFLNCNNKKCKMNNKVLRYEFIKYKTYIKFNSIKTQYYMGIFNVYI